MVETETASSVQLRPAGMGAITSTCLDGEGTWVIALAGEHDASTTPFLDRRTYNVWRRCDLVIVDLSAATFIDSSVIDWLLRTRNILRTTGHHGLRVVTGPPGTAASRALRLLSPELRGLLCCHATVEAAADLRHAAETATPRPPRATATEPVPTVFDRVEARAWVLAVWIVRDVQLADELVMKVFTEAQEAGTSPRDDDRLVCDVRRLAIGAAPSQRSARVAGEAVRETILSLPDAQREAVELSLFGGLSIEALAAVTRTPRAQVIGLLVDAMRVLRPVLGRRSKDGGALASALPVPPTRLVPPERWAARSRAGAQRTGAERRVAAAR
jgi:DNA-directed RNA polymerase specialized sigma24 family protein/anti-anti-sigma regulatory factor